MMNYWKPFGNIKGKKKEKKEGTVERGRILFNLEKNYTHVDRISLYIINLKIDIIDKT
jgi:hypothetical protein